jgi:hypothetical protein
MATKSKKSTMVASPPISIELAHVDTDYKITQLPNKHLGKSIYKIEFELPDGNTCVNYMDNASKHVVFKNKSGNYLMFHLENKPISEKSKETFEKALKKKKKMTRNTDLCKDAVILSSCIPEIDLGPAQSEIVTLNRVLESKCPNLTFKLKPFHEFTEQVTRYSETGHVCIGCKFYETLILALCTKPDEKCVSTIELVISPTGEVLINSKTDTAEEGKKYNKVLRSILFIIASKISAARYIKSIAINPVSAWLLLKYSNAIVESGDDFEKFLEDNNHTLEHINQDIIKEYYTEKNRKINLIVQFSEALSKKSREEFDEIIKDQIKC